VAAKLAAPLAIVEAPLEGLPEAVAAPAMGVAAVEEMARR